MLTLPQAAIYPGLRNEGSFGLMHVRRVSTLKVCKQGKESSEWGCRPIRLETPLCYGWRMKPAQFSSMFFMFTTGLLFCSAVSVGSAAVNGVDTTDSHLWTVIKNDSYAERVHFAKGCAKLLERIDVQVGELKAKRANLITDIDDWDFAMKEVDDSRASLNEQIESLSDANSPERWNAAKEKIGEAWNRTQKAVDKMNSTRTS